VVDSLRTAVVGDIVECSCQSIGIKAGGGYQHIRVADLSAPGRAQSAVAPRTDAQADFGAVDGVSAARHDVDHAEHRIAAIDRGAGAANDFDAFDQADGERKCRVDRAAGVDVFVDRHAVDQHLEPGAVIARLRNAAHPGIAVGRIVGDIEALQGAQGIAQGAPAVKANVLGGQDRDDGGNLVGG